MENMILATGELSDLAVITGPIGAGDMTIDHLKTQSLQEIYRVLGTTVTIDIDLGSAQTINTVALMGHNGGVHAQARITAGSNISSPIFDSGDVPLRSHQTSFTGNQSTKLAFEKNLFFQHFPDQSYRYWRIVITDPDAAFIDMGRLYLSDAFQPSYNMVWGMQNGFVDPSQEYATTSGDSVSLKRKKSRFVEFTMEDLSEDESYSELFVIDKLIGSTGDVLFVLKPDDKTYLQFNAIYGKMEQVQPFAWTTYNRFSRQYRIKELLP